MLIYQAGVASAFHACPSFMSRVKRVMGTSGGACVGVLLLACPERIEEALEYYCTGAFFRGATVADALDPTARLLPRFVEELSLLPPRAHSMVRGEDGRPWLSVHVTPRRLPVENVSITDFASNAELINAVQASCCLHPRGVQFRGEWFMDGGISNSLPLCAEHETVTISPFVGSGIDLAPGFADGNNTLKCEVALSKHRAARATPSRLGQWMRYHPSMHNARALFDAAIPRGRQVAEKRFADGVRDGNAFLRLVGHLPSADES